MAKKGTETTTVGARIYNIIRNNIVNLNLAPGTAMSEQELAEKLDVSRTPIREAFIKLSQEGLVTIIPQKGTFVSKIDYFAAYEERFIRESLEKSVFEIFIEDKAEESVVRLKKNLEKQKAAIENGDFSKFMEYDDQFHKIFFEDTGKIATYEIAVKMGGNYRRLRFLSMLVGDVVKSTFAQHEELVCAIDKGEVDLSKDCLRSHLRKIMAEKDDMLEKYPEYFVAVENYEGETEIVSENNIFAKIKNNAKK